MFIQCWYRRRFARRAAAATKLQAALRMRFASRSFQRLRSSALVIQARFSTHFCTQHSMMR